MKRMLAIIVAASALLSIQAAAQNAAPDADGVIKAVTIQGLVIVQEVNDPLSLVKQLEVTKRLRSLEDAKQ